MYKQNFRAFVLCISVSSGSMHAMQQQALNWEKLQPSVAADISNVQSKLNAGKILITSGKLEQSILFLPAEIKGLMQQISTKIQPYCKTEEPAFMKDKDQILNQLELISTELSEVLQLLDDE